MRILNFGSLNLDYVYSVDHIVRPGETISSLSLEIFPGGKGLNQSVALARAGASVFHAGMVGQDGGPLLKTCRENGVNTSHIRMVDERSGNAIIQVASGGQNSIVLFGGANRQNDRAFIERVLTDFSPGDWLLLQNEVNLPEEIIRAGARAGLKIALNPSPYNELMDRCDLGKVSLFFVNEVEAAQITGETGEEAILSAMRKKYPDAAVALTLGKKGAIYSSGGETLRHGVYRVPAVDTTAAGDTFTGYFLAALSRGEPSREALREASVASSLAVSQKGASPSIPWRKAVLEADLEECRI